MAISKGKLAVYSGATAAVATPSGLLISRELEHTQTINNLKGEITSLNQNINNKNKTIKEETNKIELIVGVYKKSDPNHDLIKTVEGSNEKLKLVSE